MTRLSKRAARRAVLLSLRLRLIRHGRSLVGTLIVLAWLAGLALGLPLLADSAEQDPAGFGIVVLYLIIACLAFAWGESD
jgi:hypothetical protein